MKHPAVISTLIFGISLLGYSLINNYYKEKARIQEQEAEQKAKDLQFKQKMDCFNTVGEGFQQRWNNACAEISSSDNCSLPIETANFSINGCKTIGNFASKYTPTNNE